MNKKKVLFIGLVWPEPTSSAAGTRIIQLINLFLSKEYKVYFASAASKSEYSYNFKRTGVLEKNIKLNDDSFNAFLTEIDPDLVIFDRYMIEEQYGWRVQQECPGAVRILDTEDLHCLRNARQQAVKNGGSFTTADLFSDMAKREIAAILRCDLSLVISEIEMNILKEEFHVDPSLIYYLPFLEEEITANTIQQWNNFEEREGFVFIGNFLHEPNWHTLQQLKNKIWPILKKKLPQASLHVYGAYASQKVTQLHNEREMFYIHGRAKDAREAIARHKILLAPIQFGAGVKGKFIDAMQVGTPAVTTSVGAEAMNGNLDWNGVIEDDPREFINQAIQLYKDESWWLQSQQNGIRIINERYGKVRFEQQFIQAIEVIASTIVTHRNHNFFGQILHYHTANSTKYMSLWIEAKNKNDHLKL